MGKFGNEEKFKKLNILYFVEFRIEIDSKLKCIIFEFISFLTNATNITFYNKYDATLTTSFISKFQY